MRRYRRAGFDHHLAARCGEARQIGRAGPGRIDAVGAELLVGDAGGRGDQRADIHLAVAAEDDAALVDHIDLAVGLDVAEDLARRRAAIDAVERGPVAIALLVESQRRARADIETRPVQDRLLGGLADIDLGLAIAIDALRRRIGAGPPRRHIRQQTAGTEAIRHRNRGRRRHLRSGGSRAGSGLHRLNVLYSPCRARE